MVVRAVSGSLYIRLLIERSYLPGGPQPSCMKAQCEKKLTLVLWCLRIDPLSGSN